jgi:tetratricopeptide (TPR) repeat protein
MAHPIGLMAGLVFLASAGQASAAAPNAPQLTAESASPNYCLQVKDVRAQKSCLDARALYYRGNLMAGLVLLNKAVEYSPKEGILRALIANLMIARNNMGPAERELRQARRDGAPDQVVLPMLFGVMISLHKDIGLLNEFPEPAPGAKDGLAAEILLGRARALRSLDRLPEAAASADRALALNRSASALLTRAGIATRQNDPALAQNLVDEAYRRNPTNHPVLLAKLAQLEKSGDPATLLALCDRIQKAWPLNDEPKFARIRFFLKQNQDPKAKAEVDAMLVRKSQLQEALFYRAVLLSRAHNKVEAANIIRNMRTDLILAKPRYAVQMAQIAIDNGNVELGASLLSTALSTAPDSLETRLMLAGVRLNQNSPQSAQLILTPIKDSPDPRVQKLLTQIRGQIVKDRSF